MANSMTYDQCGKVQSEPFTWNWLVVARLSGSVMLVNGSRMPGIVGDYCSADCLEASAVEHAARIRATRRELVAKGLPV